MVPKNAPRKQKKKFDSPLGDKNDTTECRLQNKLKRGRLFF